MPVRLLDIGIDENTDHHLLRTIKSVNLFSWLTIIGIIFGATNVVFLKGDYPLLPELCFLVVGIIVVLLNHRKKYSQAAFLIILNINCAVFFINEFYDQSTGTYMFYFPLIICITLIYSPGFSFKSIFLYYLISASFFVCTFLFDFDFIKNTNISDANNKILFTYNIIFCFCISVVLIFLLLRVINNQNSKLLNLLNNEKQALQEKEILLAEIHHRVKNNLTVINSLFNLQINSTTNEEAKNILIENSSRILSISKVHEKLYSKNDFSKIEFAEYADELIDEILYSHQLQNNVQINKELQQCELPISTAIPTGLILNEMLTNCFKHAFHQVTNPIINIQLRVVNKQVTISVKDNGIGFNLEQLESTEKLGIILMKSLTEQIDGKIEFKNNNSELTSHSKSGAIVEVTFPMESA